MKIKFIAYWNSDLNIYNFINDIWNIDHIYDNILTYGDDYTHLIIFNKAYFNFKKETTYGIIVEPYWSPNFDKLLQEKCNKLITCQPDKYLTYDNIVFSPTLAMHRLYDLYNREISYKEDTTKNIINSKFEKTKKLSIIVNYHEISEYSESLYSQRAELVKKLLESDLEFDLYGPNWSTNDRRYKGFLLNKMEGLKNYQYTIALENSNISANITEKFIDPILCDTIPIYNGHVDIQKYYPNSCEYLEYDGNEIQRIKEIINSNKTFNEYELENSKQLFLKKYNPIKVIKELIENN